jgi:hypothetical protein
VLLAEKKPNLRDLSSFQYRDLFGVRLRIASVAVAYFWINGVLDRDFPGKRRAILDIYRD